MAEGKRNRVVVASSFEPRQKKPRLEEKDETLSSTIIQIHVLHKALGRDTPLAVFSIQDPDRLHRIKSRLEKLLELKREAGTDNLMLGQSQGKGRSQCHDVKKHVCESQAQEKRKKPDLCDDENGCKKKTKRDTTNETRARTRVRNESSSGESASERNKSNRGNVSNLIAEIELLNRILGKDSSVGLKSIKDASRLQKIRNKLRDLLQQKRGSKTRPEKIYAVKNSGQPDSSSTVQPVFCSRALNLQSRSHTSNPTLQAQSCSSAPKLQEPAKTSRSRRASRITLASIVTAGVLWLLTLNTKL